MSIRVCSRGSRLFCASSGLLPLLASAFACLCANVVDADLFSGSVGYRTSYSDNLTKETRGESDWLHAPYVQLNATHQSNSYGLAADYHVERRMYVNETYSDDTIVSGRGTARVSLVPDAVDWTINHSRTETAVNSRAAVTPVNSQVVNVFSTGPSLSFQLDGRTSTQLSVFFQDVSADRTSNNSKRWSGDFAIRRSLDARSLVGVAARYSDTNFDAVFGQDYRVRDMRLTYSRDQGARTHLDLELGAASVETDDRIGLLPDGSQVVISGGGTSLDWSGSLSIAREISSAVSASIQAVRQTSDEGARLGAGAAQFGTDIGGGTNARQSYLEETVRVSVSRDGPRLQTGVTLNYGRQTFDELRESEQRRGVSVNARYQIGRRLTASAYATLDGIKFQELQGQDVRRSARVQLLWDPFKSLSISASIGWEDRQGAGQGRFVDYEESGGSFGIDYRF